MLTVLDTACLPPVERTAAWAEATERALVGTRFTFPDADRFGARIRAMPLGPAQMSTMSYTRLVSYRSRRLIRASDPELYQVGVITEGEQAMEQAGNRVVLRPGDLVVYDSSRPFQACAQGPRGCASVVVQFPRRLLPLPDNAVAPLCGTVLDGTTGAAHVFRQAVLSLTAAERGLGADDRHRLGATVIDLAAAALARYADRRPALRPDTVKALLYGEITATISRHLHDPGLKPPAIAALHSISPRHLHRVFQEHGTTVGAFVRAARIARCRRDLADTALHATPVSAIGARWGFASASDFTRAFKAATGMTPTDWRNASRTPPDGVQAPSTSR